MPPKFFLTHSSRDMDFACRLCDDLAANGVGGFFDAYSIKPGDVISAEIARGLEACDIYVPILSHAALKSPWCEEEINAAIMLGKLPGRNGRPRIVPVLIEDCAGEMPIFLRSRLYIEFANRYDEAIEELLTKGFGIAASSSQPESGPEPEDARGHVERGRIYKDNGEIDGALADFNKAIELDPKYADAYYARGLLHRQKGSKIQAIADFETYVRLAPDAYDRDEVEGWILMDQIAVRGSL